MQLRKRSLLKTSLIALPLGLAVAAAAYAGRSNCWMTGGGSVFRDNGGEVVLTGPKIGRVTHGFELRCEGRPNNLEINWDGNRFHLENLATAVCTDSPLITPNPPDAEFDTFTGTGTGRYNGTPGANIEFVFTDAGEGGSGDTAAILITDAGGATLLEVSGYLTFGNHQAHSN